MKEMMKFLLTVLFFLISGCYNNDDYRGELIRDVYNGPKKYGQESAKREMEVMKIGEPDSTGLTWIILRREDINMDVLTFIGHNHGLKIGDVAIFTEYKFRLNELESLKNHYSLD